jgi:hypothetical protein
MVPLATDHHDAQAVHEADPEHPSAAMSGRLSYGATATVDPLSGSFGWTVGVARLPA